MFIFHNRILLYLTGALITVGLSNVSLAGPGKPSADNASVSHGVVIDVPQLPDIVPVPNASSVLVRNRHGVTVSFNASGLEPNAVHTFWLFVWNEPQFCTRDDGTGLLCDSTLDKAIRVTTFAGSRISDEWGQISFEGTLFYGDVINEDTGEELRRGAEIHIVAFSHGSAAALEEAGLLELAMTTNTGCVDPVIGANDGKQGCRGVQAAGHAP